MLLQKEVKNANLITFEAPNLATLSGTISPDMGGSIKTVINNIEAL